MKTIFEFKILGAGMSLVSHESPQDSLIKKLTEYVKARGDPEKEVKHTGRREPGARGAELEHGEHQEQRTLKLNT